MTQVLDDAALNRATLHRQWLDRRRSGDVADAIGHLVGLQAQAADAPYVGLWTRLAGFSQEALTAALVSRVVVRAGVLRGTQHLVLARDYPRLRALVQPIGERRQQAAFGRRTAGVDLDDVAVAARDLLRGRIVTRPQLRDLLATRFVGHDADALAWSVPSLVPVVHPPPNGTWRRGGPTPFALAEEWLGRSAMEPEAIPDPLVLRYLSAFGPASVCDIQTWSGLRRLTEVVERLPLLRLQDQRGQELVDLPDAARPDLEAETPVRFLPEFDNLLVAYADRSRLMSEEIRRRVCVGSLIHPTLLVDGRVVGVWRFVRAKSTTALEIEPFVPLTKDQSELVQREGEELLAFAAYPSSKPTEVRVVNRN